MNIRLHANAITTPKIRQYIQASHQSAPQLADELGVSEDTIRLWRGRDGVADGSHTPHRLQTPHRQWQDVYRPLTAPPANASRPAPMP